MTVDEDHMTRFVLMSHSQSSNFLAAFAYGIRDPFQLLRVISASRIVRVVMHMRNRHAYEFSICMAGSHVGWIRYQRRRWRPRFFRRGRAFTY